MMVIWLLAAVILWSLQGRFVNAEFLLRIDIDSYENLDHQLESDVCCEDCLPLNLSCGPLSCRDRFCENIFEFVVYDEGCHSPACNVLATLEYYYGRDDSNASRGPVIIVGQHACPEGPLVVDIVIYHKTTSIGRRVGTLELTGVRPETSSRDISIPGRPRGPRIQLQYQLECEPSSSLLPSSPTVTIQSVTASTILLTWSVPSGSVVDSYDIEWRSSEEEVGTATISGETPVYTIEHLKAATRYAIVVTARNAAGTAQSKFVTTSTTSITAPVSGRSCGPAIGVGVGVGIAVVGTAAVVLVVVVILFLRRKKKRPLPPTPGIVRQPNPIYEIPIDSHKKQGRGGIGEDDNTLRYSNRMNLNISYNAQSQVRQELQQQFPPARKESEGGGGGDFVLDKDANDADDYEEYEEYVY